jgi:ketosteroid isomerase-like protein
LKLTFRIVAGALVVVALNAALPAKSNSSMGGEVDRIIVSERQWAKAAVDGDAAGMAKFMADDYVEIEIETVPGTKTNRCVTTNKTQWIELVKSRREKYESVDLRNLRVYVHTDVATVTGEYSQTGTKDGKDISGTGVYVDTWVKKNGSWQLVSSVFP